MESRKSGPVAQPVADYEIVPGDYRRTGRIYQPDARDREHELDASALRGITRIQPALHARPWRLGPILDQGQTDRCTVFSFAGFLQAEPYRHTLSWPEATFNDWYYAAQLVDGIAGAHSGSTERAVQQVASLAGS